MNWLDLLVFLLIGLTLVDGFRRGFIHQILELAAFIVSIWVALSDYLKVADWLVLHYHTSPLLAKPVAFLSLWLAIEGVTFFLLWLTSRFIPETLKKAWLNHFAGIVPAAIKTVVYLGVGLTIGLSLPLPSDVKLGIEQSWTGPRLISTTSSVTSWLERSLGRTFGETFNFLTTAENETGYHLPAVTDSSKLHVEPTMENEVLVLLNGERTRAGLKPLVSDPEVQAVARAHSLDMWQRGYFDHVDPDGKGVAERLRTAGITYLIAGENLALAPTVLIAHEGLMRSPSHRENILHPDFGRVGIGIVSAGANGILVTQDFRN